MHTKATAEQLTAAQVFTLFTKWIAQQPGLDPRDYGTDPNGHRAYRAEVARISKERRRAMAALKTAQGYDFDAAAMLEATQRAFSGRLEFVYSLQKGLAIDYTTGQYWPTEYRAAAAAVLEQYNDTQRPKHTPQPGQRFNTVQDLAAANHAAGGHWFSKDAKRFFRSRILAGVYQGRNHVYFVTSECSTQNERDRRFSARVFDVADATVNSLGDFNSYRTAGDARAAARRAADRDSTGDHFKPENMGTKCDVCGHYGEYCTGQKTAQPVTS